MVGIAVFLHQIGNQPKISFNQNISCLSVTLFPSLNCFIFFLYT